MRYALIVVACLCAPGAAQELPEANPEVQTQLKKTYDTIRRLGIISYDNVEVFAEAQKVKELIAPQEDDDDEVLRLSEQVEVMEQLAIFVATTESSEDTHVLLSLMIWRYLQMSPDATIQVLARHLDASDDSLRRFAREWLSGHDDFEDFKRYAQRQKVPDPLVALLYERSPGQALLLFQRGSAAADVQAAIRQLEGDGGEVKREPDGRDILLAEHIVSNALWLHKNKFDERFQAALPEAMAELEKLAKHEQWWARLYVVHIMRRHPVLLQDHVLRKLAEDENSLVREAAKRKEAAQPAPKPGEPLVAPRNVESRAVGPTSVKVSWEPSVGATSYTVQRRQPDTETEFTTIAANVASTTYTDSGFVRNTLYEYRVVAQHNP